MFSFIKKLFKTSHTETPEPTETPNKPVALPTKPCLTCGKPITYDPAWEHIPNYCSECKAKYKAEHPKREYIRRKCRGCGKPFSFPADLKHKPNYCRECQRKRARNRESY